MRNAIRLAIGSSILVGLATMPGFAAPTPGSLLSVRALRAPLMARPRFFGASIQVLKRGAKVTFVSRKGSWYQVAYRGRRGWIHKNRLAKKVLMLRAGATRGGGSGSDAALAGRGFNPQVETEYRRRNVNLDFGLVDSMQAMTVSSVDVAGFFQSGGLRIGGGR